MSSFRNRSDRRREIFLSLSGSIESQLRDAFAKQSMARTATQSVLADKLGVNRSVINRRLTGQQNMTVETIADMVWALGQCIEVNIFDPAEQPHVNHPLSPSEDPEPVSLNGAGPSRTKSSSREIKSRLEMAS